MRMEDVARIRSLKKIQRLMRQFEGKPEDDMPMDKEDMKEAMMDDEPLEPEYDDKEQDEVMEDSASDSDDEFEDEKKSFMRRGSSRGAPGSKNHVVIVEAMKMPAKKAK